MILPLSLILISTAAVWFLKTRSVEGFQDPERGFVLGPLPLDVPDFGADGQDLKPLDYGFGRLPDADGHAVPFNHAHTDSRERP